MIRRQVYITEEEKKGLEALSNMEGVSQSNLIREAIDELLKNRLKQDRLSVIDSIAGIWETKTETIDVRDLRKSWSRRSGR